MSNSTFVHWNKQEGELQVNINVHKPVKMKAAMYNGNGKCILNVFDKFCSSGEFNEVKKIKNIVKGLYTMKFNTDEEQYVIRFWVN